MQYRKESASGRQPGVTVGVVGGSPQEGVAWASRLASLGARAVILAESPGDVRTYGKLGYRGQTAPTIQRLLDQRPDGLVVVSPLPGAVEAAATAAGRGCHLLVDQPHRLRLPAAEQLASAAATGAATIHWAWDDALSLGELASCLLAGDKRTGIGAMKSIELSWRWSIEPDDVLERLTARAFAVVQALSPIAGDVTVHGSMSGRERSLLMRGPGLAQDAAIRFGPTSSLSEPELLKLKANGTVGTLTARLTPDGTERMVQPRIALHHRRTSDGGRAPFSRLEAPPTVAEALELRTAGWLDALHGRTAFTGVLGRDGLTPLALREAAGASFDTGRQVTLRIG